MANKHETQSGLLERESAQRKRRTGRLRALALCALCVILISVLALDMFTDLLSWSHSVNYPLKYDDIIIARSREYSLDPALVCAVVYSESSFQPKAVSPVGARGLMQIMPETGEWIAQKLRIPDYNADMLFEPDLNINFGCWMLRYLFDRFDGDDKKALAAYNAGAARVDEWLKRADCSPDGVTLEYIPGKETRNYVKKVRAMHDIFIDLYASRLYAQLSDPI